MPTIPTDQAFAAGSKRFASLATFRANKPLSPTQPLKKSKAGLLIVKPIEKLAPCTRVISYRNRIEWEFAHHYILTEVELTGYPPFIYSISQIPSEASCRGRHTPEGVILETFAQWSGLEAMMVLP